MNTTEVENYPGFPGGIIGPDLMDAMRKQAERFGAALVAGDVTEVDLKADPKRVSAGGETYLAKAVIIATGSGYREPGVPGENRFGGHGVSWCATCDGFFFRDQDIAVAGVVDKRLEPALAADADDGRGYPAFAEAGDQRLVEIERIGQREDVVRVPLDGQIISEPFSLLIRVGVAAHPREQARVVHDASFSEVSGRALSQPQGDQARPDHVLHRLPETQVGPERQQGDKFSAANPGASRRPLPDQPPPPPQTNTGRPSLQLAGDAPLVVRNEIFNFPNGQWFSGGGGPVVPGLAAAGALGRT
jgi:Pyridine nucleotide-disulphide oxidoreductase